MKTILFILFIGCIKMSYTQVNLVPNPSFEQCVTNCNNGGVIGDLFYYTMLNNWYNPNTCTPDFYSAYEYPPLNYYQIPDSQSFIGVATYDPNATNGREYVACQLLDTLITERFYKVSFYARVLAGLSRFASNNLGVHFSDTALQINNPYLFNINNPPLLQAQVKYFNNEVISDTAHWTLVSGLYQAHGGEKYLTLGNFNTDAQTTQGMEYMDGAGWQSYFAIDMVSVIPLDSLPEGIPAYAGADTTIFINDTTFIGQKISNMPSVWHKLDGTQIASNTAGVYVSPQETTSYVVSHTLNGIFSADTVTVTVIDNLGLEEAEKQRIELYPMPCEGDFNIQGQLLGGDVVQIIDVKGKLLEIRNVDSDTKMMQVDSNLPSGTYAVVIQDENKQEKFRSRVVVIK